MTTSAPYDKNNIFAKILRQEIPCDKVYEDEFVLAFRDINPQAEQHILVIPKGEYSSWDDFSASASPQEIVAFVQAVGEVARRVSGGGEGESAGAGAGAGAGALPLNSGGYRLIANNGVHANQEVPHLHVHILGGENLGGLLPDKKIS